MSEEAKKPQKHEKSRQLTEEAAVKLIERCHHMATTRQPGLAEMKSIAYCLRESWYLLMMIDGPSMEEMEKMMGYMDDDDDDDFEEDDDDFEVDDDDDDDDDD